MKHLIESDELFLWHEGWTVVDMQAAAVRQQAAHLDACGVLGLAEDLKQLVIGQEVEPVQVWGRDE